MNMTQTTYSDVTTANDLLYDSYYVTQAQERTKADFLQFAKDTINLRQVDEYELETFHDTVNFDYEDEYLEEKARCAKTFEDFYDACHSIAINSTDIWVRDIFSKEQLEEYYRDIQEFTQVS